LNQRTGSRYRAVPVNLKLVRGRLQEGHSLADVKAVVDAKFNEWGEDPKMRQYLRPKTLFAATNFSNYVGQLGQVANEQENWWASFGYGTRFEAENAGLNRFSKHSEVSA